MNGCNKYIIVARNQRIMQCLFEGSRDNMSAVLVAFPGLKRDSKGEGVMGRRARRNAEDSEVHRGAGQGRLGRGEEGAQRGRAEWSVVGARGGAGGGVGASCSFFLASGKKCFNDGERGVGEEKDEGFLKGGLFEQRRERRRRLGGLVASWQTLPDGASRDTKGCKVLEGRAFEKVLLGFRTRRAPCCQPSPFEDRSSVTTAVSVLTQGFPSCPFSWLFVSHLLPPAPCFLRKVPFRTCVVFFFTLV